MIPEVWRRNLHTDVEAEALRCGYTPLQAHLLAGRLSAPRSVGVVGRSIRDLDPPDLLPDIDVAADAIVRAIIGKRQQLQICTDHDADGAASHFVLRAALIGAFGVPESQVLSLITHRMREGYGVSDKFVDRMLEVCTPGGLCITADQGSADESRIARLRAEKNVVTVVTDHHGIPAAGVPRSAIACVNPIRKDCEFPDPCIAGCHVAWLVMCAVRQRLIACGWLPKNAPSLASLLDVVAVGTCADAVSLGASRNNRTIIAYGLHLMNSPTPRPCWTAMRAIMKLDGPFTTKDISHGIAPRVNARGRLGDAMASVNFLYTQDSNEALRLAALLDSENQARKAVQQGMTGPALEIGGVQAEAGRAALVVHLVDGHSGVHGIVASRLVEAYGRPVCCLSPKQGAPGHVTGSLRSVPGVDIRAALVRVSEHHPGLLLNFGGHKGAAGVGLLTENVESFADALCEAVAQQADPASFVPVVWTDGPLPIPASMAALEEIEALEPYGREFEPPQFSDQFTVASARPVGDGSHLKLDLVDDRGARYGAIWFRAMEPGEQPPVGAGETATFVYSLAANRFRGRTRLDLHVVALDQHGVDTREGLAPSSCAAA